MELKADVVVIVEVIVGSCCRRKESGSDEMNEVKSRREKLEAELSAEIKKVYFIVSN